jgi:hypothetical protein
MYDSQYVLRLTAQSTPTATNHATNFRVRCDTVAAAAVGAMAANEGRGSDSVTLLAKFNPAATETIQRGAEDRHDDAETIVQGQFEAPQTPVRVRCSGASPSRRVERLRR